MNGIIVINKPSGWTSFDVIAKLRGVLHERRIGHGGTLDPMATGVLPLFLGKAAKASDMLPVTDKSYLASFRLGERTDTLDISGKLLERCEVAAKKEDILAALENFKGRITQLPPMFSAVKVDGRKLYQYARAGKQVERCEREAFVYTLCLESYDEITHEGMLFIECSKGTYVRTIIDDLGNALGCGGVMTALVRTSSGGFALENSYTLATAPLNRFIRLLSSASVNVHFIKTASSCARNR